MLKIYGFIRDERVQLRIEMLLDIDLLANQNPLMKKNI